MAPGKGRSFLNPQSLYHTDLRIPWDPWEEGARGLARMVCFQPWPPAPGRCFPCRWGGGSRIEPPKAPSLPQLQLPALPRARWGPRQPGVQACPGGERKCKSTSDPKASGKRRDANQTLGAESLRFHLDLVERRRAIPS